jgi:hypothetical protein
MNSLSARAERILAWTRSEPVTVLLVFVQSAIALVCAFGLQLTPKQAIAIMAFAAAALGLVARRLVTANVNVPPAG